MSDAGRTSVREPASSGGFIDAAWWHASNDLVAELPPLLATYRKAGREIVHVVFNIGAWRPTPKRATIDGRKIKFGGFNAGEVNTVGLVDRAGKPTIQVLIVPPDTDPDIANRVLKLAATSDSTDRPAEMRERARTTASLSTARRLVRAQDWLLVLLSSAMSWLSVEIDDFVDAAKIMCDEIGEPVRIANARLGTVLADCGSMAGDDDGGRGWAAAYDPAAHSVLTATNQVAAAAFQTASMFGRSATNYAAAEHSSTAGQAASSGTPLARRLPAEGILGPPRTPPSAAGGGGDAPAGWALIKDLVGYVWPNGHQDRLRRAAAAYRHCASALESVAIQPACASVTFIRDRLPEADDINTVCGGVADRIRSLIGAHQTLARSCDDLADHIDHCHAEVESELQELALESVAIQTVGAVLSFFSFGAAEVPAQAVQAGRIAAVAGKVAEIIRRFVTAAKALDAAIPTVTETAQAVGRALDKLANARLAYAGVTDVRRIDRVAMAGRGGEAGAAGRLAGGSAQAAQKAMNLAPRVSAQRQARHVLGSKLYRGGGYFKNGEDAQRVLDAYRRGEAELIRVTKTGHLVVRYPKVTGFNHNVAKRYLHQPTDVFIIKGTRSVSVVPYTPTG